VFVVVEDKEVLVIISVVLILVLSLVVIVVVIGVVVIGVVVIVVVIAVVVITVVFASVAVVTVLVVVTIDDNCEVKVAEIGNIVDEDGISSGDVDSVEGVDGATSVAVTDGDDTLLVGTIKQFLSNYHKHNYFAG